MVMGNIYVNKPIQEANDRLIDMLGASTATIESRSLERIDFTHGSFFAATPTNSTKTGALKLTTQGKGTRVEYECNARTYYKIIWAIVGIVTFGIGFIGYYIYTMKGPRKYIENMMNAIAMPRYAEAPPIETEAAPTACPQCGAQLPPDSVFCPNCGTSVQ
jgi:hypothetical protein